MLMRPVRVGSFLLYGHRPFCIPVLHLRLASRLGVYHNQVISGISLSFLVPGFWHMFLVRCSVFDPAPWLLMVLCL